MKKLNRVDWNFVAVILLVAMCVVVLLITSVIAIIDVAIGMASKDFALVAILMFALAISRLITSVIDDLKEYD